MFFISRAEKEKAVYDFALNFFEKQEKAERERGVATIPAILQAKQFVRELKMRKLISQKYKLIMQRKSA